MNANAMSMEAPPVIPAPPAAVVTQPGGGWRRCWRVCVGLALLMIAAPVMFAVAVMNIDGETKALQNAVISLEPDNWQKQFELDLGSAPFFLARMVAPMIKEIPPEAQAAISAVRDAEFSIYQLKGDFPDTAKALAKADAKMEGRGYYRVTGVCERDALVAIYVHEKTKSIDDLRVSALVIADRQLITIGAEANLEQVMDLAMREANKHLPARK
jgi:hypothetical protein